LGCTKELTVLPGFLQTCQQIDLNVHIVRGLCELDLIPTLRCSPPSRFAMSEDLLVYIEYMKMCRYSFNSIRLIDLSVDIL
jgi:hypothetical protein